MPLVPQAPQYSHGFMPNTGHFGAPFLLLVESLNKLYHRNVRHLDATNVSLPNEEFLLGAKNFKVCKD